MLAGMNTQGIRERQPITHYPNPPDTSTTYIDVDAHRTIKTFSIKIASFHMNDDRNLTYILGGREGVLS